MATLNRAELRWVKCSQWYGSNIILHQKNCDHFGVPANQTLVLSRVEGVPYGTVWGEGNGYPLNLSGVPLTSPRYHQGYLPGQDWGCDYSCEQTNKLKTLPYPALRMQAVTRSETSTITVLRKYVMRNIASHQVAMTTVRLRLSVQSNSGPF